MPPWRSLWPGLALLPLLWGCALRGGQPAPPHVSPSPVSALASQVSWGWEGDPGLLIGACLGCLPALALLWLGGQRRLTRRARPRVQSSPLILLTRLRFLRREINKLMAQGRGQAQVVRLGPSRPRRRPPPGPGQDRL